MFIYLIKSILCSALFISAYYLLLEKERIHRFKRWYLLITLLLSFVIPLITVEIGKPELASQISNISEYFIMDTPQSAEQSQIPSTTTENTTDDFNWLTLVLIGYGIITAILLVRIFNNFLSILSDVSNKSTQPYRDAMLVVHHKHAIPYSFQNYIFISPQDINNRQILLHELTHVRQRHTLDILLIELIHCLMWFNPAIHFYKKAIQLNHEFLADEVVIRNHSTSSYQKILLQKSQASGSLSLVSSLNYSVTKKRFIMMTKSKNQIRSAFKMVLTCVITIGAMILFIEKTYAQTASTATDSIGRAITNHTSTDSTLVYFDCVYNKIKQKQVLKSGKERVIYNLTGITDECKAYLLSIYNSMTAEQKEKYPETVTLFTPIPPPVKKSPTSEQLVAWYDPTIYGVWLDGNRIANAELSSYKATDIAHVFMSRLMKNAAHYGQYKFHVDLMTHPYFDKTYPPKSE